MQGPITVFDQGSYAGDARIEDLAPGQERLLSYALDLKTEVEPQAGEGEQKLVDLRIKKGTLVTVHKFSNAKTYLVRNRDTKEKRVLIEHPFQSDWKLIEPKDPGERTRDVYRLAVAVKPDETKSLVVREEKQTSEEVSLTNFDNDTLAFYVRAKEVQPRIKEALQRVVSLRDLVNQTALEKGRKQQRFTEIGQEQSRIRENLARLNENSELYARYVKKLDQQETELEGLRREIETLKETEAKQAKELNDFLISLNID
jgi:hypothetical protein